MLQFFKKSKNATETHTQKDCVVDGEGVVTEQTCQKWFAVLHAVNFSLKDSPKSARPVKVDSDKIQTLLGPYYVPLLLC